MKQPRRWRKATASTASNGCVEMCVDAPSNTTEVNIRDSKLAETAPYMTVPVDDMLGLVALARQF